ncbi:hypothetical protein [Chitinimonas naiadis]
MAWAVIDQDKEFKMDMLAAMRRYGWVVCLMAIAVGQCGAAQADADVEIKPMLENVDAKAETPQRPAEARLQLAAASTEASTTAVRSSNKLRLGTWSYEVEQMAKANGCQGSGAWLVKDAEGSQHYRMQCASGAVYAATCNTNGQCLED